MNKFKLPMIMGMLFVLLFSFVLTEKPAVAANEYNFEQIEFNKSYTGQLNYQQHGYKVVMPKDGNFKISLNRHETSSWQVEVVDANTDYILETFHSENLPGVEEREIGLKRGTYYIVLSGYTRGSEVPYSFNVSNQSIGTLEKELNDSTKTANKISLNKTYNGAIQDYRDKDYYRISLSKNGNVTINMSKQTSKSWYVTLIDSKGKKYIDKYTDSNVTVSGTQKFYVGLKKGTYYVIVSNSYSTEDVKYSLKVDYKASEYYEKEFNDSKATATVVKLKKTYTGALQSYNDLDYYKFSLSSTKKISLSLSRNRDDFWQVTLFDSKGNQLTRFYTKSGTYGTGYEKYTRTLKKGTYYVVVSYSLKNTSYKLKVSY